MLNHSKSLMMGYRKCFKKIPITICQISLVFQVIFWTIALNEVQRVDALREYDRLSISNGNPTTAGFFDIESGVTHAGGGFDMSSVNDFRHVSHEELLSIGGGFDNFTDPGVTHFSEILFDFDHYQVC